MNVSPIIKFRTLAIAKALAPLDSGNLRHNAISLTKVRGNTWTITYNTKQATYIEPLQEGWTNNRTGEVYQTHKGFIDRTVLVLGNYVFNVLSGKKQSTNKYLKTSLSSAQGNAKRDMVNLKSQLFYSDYKHLAIQQKSKKEQYII